MNSFITFLPLIIILGGMYYMMWRTMRRQREQQKSVMEGLKVGANIITVGGLHGEVTALTDDTVTIKSGTTKLVFDRNAVAKIETTSTTSTKKVTNKKS